jgi:hypothetical protein
VDPIAGVNDVEKRKYLTLKGLERRPLGRPARSPSLNRLRYPGSFVSTHIFGKSESHNILGNELLLSESH